ncbi:MAG: sodium/proline symporter, partial [Gammaproteobacteria bacterium]
MSYAGVLANYWPGQNFYYVQKIAALLLIFLLMSYASAQMLAGSKALLALINWPLEAGVIVSAIMIALYCWAGGIRASVWT